MGTPSATLSVSIAGFTPSSKPVVIHSVNGRRGEPANTAPAALPRNTSAKIVPSGCNDWRKRLGVEPSGPPEMGGPIGFEDQDGHRAADASKFFYDTGNAVRPALASALGPEAKPKPRPAPRPEPAGPAKSARRRNERASDP